MFKTPNNNNKKENYTRRETLKMRLKQSERKNKAKRVEEWPERAERAKVSAAVILSVP